MKKKDLIKNPHLFQGENKLKNDSNNTKYFEGWYFKNSNNEQSISFIPGINIDQGHKNAFIQVISNEESYYIPYKDKDFKFDSNPFSIQIGNNYFSEDKIHIDIQYENVSIKGELDYTDNVELIKTKANPNIMGPFSYIPFMECNHAILSMKHNINGEIKVNEKSIVFNNGTGYIEKDWGCSFPKSYMWGQANNFKDKDVSFFISIADIPLKIFSFTGFICVLNINDKEYRFATYNNSKIERYNISEDGNANITLKKGDLALEIETNVKTNNKLLAPKLGVMSNHINESVDSEISLKLKENDKILYEGKSYNCGVEIIK